MIKAGKVIEILDTQIVRLKKFEDENISAFVLIIPPQGGQVSFVTMDAADDAQTFFKTLAQRIQDLITESQAGGVGIPGMRR